MSAVLAEEHADVGIYDAEIEPIILNSALLQSYQLPPMIFRALTPIQVTVVNVDILDTTTGNINSNSAGADADAGAGAGAGAGVNMQRRVEVLIHLEHGTLGYLRRKVEDALGIPHVVAASVAGVLPINKDRSVASSASMHKGRLYLMERAIEEQDIPMVAGAAVEEEEGKKPTKGAKKKVNRRKLRRRDDGMSFANLRIFQNNNAAGDALYYEGRRTLKGMFSGASKIMQVGFSVQAVDIHQAVRADDTAQIKAALSSGEDINKIGKGNNISCTPLRAFDLVYP